VKLDDTILADAENLLKRLNSGKLDPDKASDEINKCITRFTAELENQFPSCRANNIALDLTVRFSSRLELEAMFIVFAQMVAFENPDVAISCLVWLDNVMSRGNNQTLDELKRDQKEHFTVVPLFRR